MNKRRMPKAAGLHYRVDDCATICASWRYRYTGIQPLVAAEDLQSCELEADADGAVTSYQDDRSRDGAGYRRLAFTAEPAENSCCQTNPATGVAMETPSHLLIQHGTSWGSVDPHFYWYTFESRGGCALISLLGRTATSMCGETSARSSDYRSDGRPDGWCGIYGNQELGLIYFCSRHIARHVLRTTPSVFRDVPIMKPSADAGLSCPRLRHCRCSLTSCTADLTVSMSDTMLPLRCSTRSDHHDPVISILCNPGLIGRVARRVDSTSAGSRPDSATCSRRPLRPGSE